MIKICLNQEPLVQLYHLSRSVISLKGCDGLKSAYSVSSRKKLSAFPIHCSNSQPL